MVIILDIETTNHIDIPAGGYMQQWIDKKEEKARTRHFNPYLDVNTAVPSLVGYQIIGNTVDAQDNTISDIIVLDEKEQILDMFQEFIFNYRRIVTFNGNFFDLPILTRMFVRSERKIPKVFENVILRLLSGKSDFSIDLMNILAPYKDDMRSLRFFAESFGIPCKFDNNKEKELWKQLDETGKVVLPDLKEKLIDDINITRELYFKIAGIK